ncbi:Putative Iron ion homeostasis-related protein [Rhizopus microsporus]|nr:Putative Iron ion homeostasis-related protein [Rhizopus microsporus]
MFAAQRNVLHRSILYKQSLFCRKPLNRFFITKTLTASHNNRRHPVWNGSVRQHGTHGHHHHDADLLTSLKSSSKRGTRITIIGLASNVGLTVSKGVAGWMMNSASLLAESLHSFSGKFFLKN